MKWLVCGLILWGGVGVQAREVPVLSIPNGIAVTVAGGQVELCVASPRAFCLGVAADPKAAPLHSIYLDAKPAAPFHVVRDGAAAGIATDFGELLVRPGDGTWTLRDAKGATLADWSPLGKETGAAANATFHFTVGASPAAEHPRYYGSGSIPVLGSLTQEGVDPRAGNGTAGLPQYWSSAGYGALVVGASDNDPGSWKANGNGVDWTVPGDRADLYLLPARDLYAWLRADAGLTGFAPVPPRWTLGYMQSRWGWVDKAYIDDTLAHFRRDELPVDTFILDFEWYTPKPDYSVPPEGDPRFVDFGYNPKLLPDPAAQFAAFARQGLHIVGIRKPRLGNSANLAMARSKGWILPVNPRDPNNTKARYRDLDFSNPAVRAYWEENNRKFLDDGMAAFWNDEGEVNFTTYSYWNMAEVALFGQVRPGARFWSLNRSFPPGLQRFGTTAWTGDIQSSWDILARTPGELLSYGLSGMPWSTCDIGGYYDTPSPELLTRWMQAGVFFPVMRAHSEHTFTPHFPWLAGPEAEAAIRQALDLRYRLIPYEYSLAHETSVSGAPVMRPLVMEFPGDPATANLTDEWLLGRDVLAAPVLNAGGRRSVYLPKDTWYALGTATPRAGPQTVDVTAKLDEIPVYVRAGTLLPLGPVLQDTEQRSQAPLELQIYPGRDGTFDFIEDDGNTTAYRTGAMRTTAFTWNDRASKLSWKVTGNYQGGNTFAAVKVRLFSSAGLIEKEGTLGRDGSLVLR